jgi:hypothetical protein
MAANTKEPLKIGITNPGANFIFFVCCHRYQHAIAINIHESSECAAPRERNEMAVTKYPDVLTQ